MLILFLATVSQHVSEVYQLPKGCRDSWGHLCVLEAHVEWSTNRVISQLYQDGCSDDRRVKEIRLLTPHCFHYFVKGL